MSGGFNRSDIVDFFLVEASEHLQILNDGLLSLEENNEDLSVVDEIFRSAHTIKGSAAMLGFIIVSKLAHKMEDLLGQIRNHETPLSEAVIDLLLQTVDSLTVQIEDIPNGVQEDESILMMFSDLYAEFLEPAEDEETVVAAQQQEALAPEPDGKAPEEEAEEEEKETLDDYELIESYELLQELEIPEDLETEAAEPDEEFTAPVEDVSPIETIAQTESALLSKPAPARKRIRSAKTSMVSAGEKKFVRVGVEGLDLLMNLVGQLVINRTRLDQRIVYLNNMSTELNFSRDRLLKVIRDFKEKYEFGQVREGASLKSEKGGEGSAESGNGNRYTEFLDGFFEMEFDQYDDFNILSRSLVEISSDISEIMNQLTNFFDQFEEESSRIRRITDNLQEEITNIRMVEVGQLFNRFHRTVRDVAKDESKLVSLKISGADAKLDKTVVDEIADPLMHLIRNSVSHGIEAPDVRESNGKPREGEVSLNAYREGDNIIIEIADNGSGIHVEQIRQTIAEKGLRTMTEIERMPDDEVIKFIFAPGFSTKKNVSAISGRGVGMDVVKTNIAKLGGSVDIKTVPGEGTKFSIKLPLTLLIYAALLVKEGEQEFAISLTSVEETARIPVNHVHNIGDREVIKLRDQVLPISRLSDILQYPSTEAVYGDNGYLSVVIVRSAEQTLALVVEELIGRETIVVKPLGDYLKKVELFSGATLSGEGKVRLILDIPTIISQQITAKLSANVTATTVPLDDQEYEDVDIAMPDEPRSPELLLIDDSISIRKVVGMFLSNAGYRIEVAVDGLDAIEKIDAGDFDLIITDLEMPRMHGYELIAELRSRDSMNDVPIIVLTSRAGDKHSQKARELGANDYIVKPVDEETLLTSVRNLLAR
jgi:chemosensory pili system protein ChpA (sensor histidine kinase/response regulator)